MHTRATSIIIQFTKVGNSTTHRVIRGGHWHGKPEVVRCGIRGSGLPGGQDDNLGFRLVRKP